MNVEELEAAMADNSDIANFVKSMVASKVEEETTGLKTKNTELLTEKKTLQTQLEGAPTPEELAEFKKIKDQIESSVDAKLISEGKLDDVISKRTERLVSDYETKFVEIKTELESLREKNSNLSSKYNNYVIDDSIRQTAIAEGVVGQALDDVVSRSTGVFSLDPDGTIVARDHEGKLVITEDGKTLNPKLFVDSLKESAPHFWPQSKGGGLNGSGDDDETLAKTAESGDISNYLKNRRKQRQPEV